MREQNTGDIVDRAMARAGVRPGSEMEKDIRASIFSIVGTGEDVEEADRKLDHFVSQQKNNPLYADSLAAPNRPPQEKKAPLDLLNLTREEFNSIVAGKTQVER